MIVKNLNFDNQGLQFFSTYGAGRSFY